MKADIKITVLKKTLNEDFLDRYADSRWELCDKFAEGQEFISSEGVHMPEGFCSWAWGDIQKCVLTLSRGGNFIGTNPGVFVTCCTDGYRPVFFKLERIGA